jgi:hypothetical protein
MNTQRSASKLATSKSAPVPENSGKTTISTPKVVMNSPLTNTRYTDEINPISQQRYTNINDVEEEGV